MNTQEIEKLLTTVAEEQIGAMSEHVARELATRPEGKMTVSIGVTLTRTTKLLTAEGGLSFSKKFAMEKTQCSAPIDRDQMDLISEDKSTAP